MFKGINKEQLEGEIYMPYIQFWLPKKECPIPILHAERVAFEEYLYYLVDYEWTAFSD